MLSSLQRTAFRQSLARGRWFGSLPEPLQQALVDHAQLHQYRARQVLCTKGQQSPGLWMMLQGQVLVSDVLDDGARFLFHVGGPGFVFGEVVVFGKPTRVEVTSTTPIQTLLVPAAKLQTMVAQAPALQQALGALESERLSRILDYLAHSRVASVEVHLRYRLEQIAALWREDGCDEPVIELCLSQGDVADLLGLSRQTVNRLLARLQSQGLVDVGFRTIRLLPKGEKRSVPRSPGA